MHAISLGFTDQRFEPGTHICQIYSDDAEREEVLLKFLLSGLLAGECVSCFSEHLPQIQLATYLADHRLSCAEVETSGQLSLAGTRDIYFSGNRFDPERMLTLLREYYRSSVTQGFSASRVIGEMTAEIAHVAGGHRLLEYEAKVSLLQKEYPVTTVCQYDARQFSGAMIMDVLKVHPLMLVRGAVIYNPYYLPPETVLATLDGGQS
jgi:hypothetical protein